MLSTTKSGEPAATLPSVASANRPSAALTTRHMVWPRRPSGAGRRGWSRLPSRRRTSPMARDEPSYCSAVGSCDTSSLVNTMRQTSGCMRKLIGPRAWSSVAEQSTRRTSPSPTSMSICSRYGVSDTQSLST